VRQGTGTPGLVSEEPDGDKTPVSEKVAQLAEDLDLRSIEA
jgi:hypothetical protein